MKRYSVVISAEAERDLFDIQEYIAENDSVERAGTVVARIQHAVDGLEVFPNRGAHPAELLDYGNRDFREVHFKPYRIVYRVVATRVVVVLIADGRRDMRALLSRRLLGA